jgi:hypothetical protein
MTRIQTEMQQLTIAERTAIVQKMFLPRFLSHTQNTQVQKENKRRK